MRLWPRRKSEAPKAATNEQLEDISVVWKRFEAAQSSRAEVEARIGLAASYIRGEQWLKWTAGMLQDCRDQDDLDWYKTVNLSRVYLQRAVARAATRRPDVTIIPENPGVELDVKAAQEAAAVDAHYDRAFEGQDQIRKLVTGAFLFTTTFLYQYWDPTGVARVPSERDAGGDNVTGYVDKAVGELREEVIPGLDVYLEPAASGIDDARWAIVAQRLPVETIESAYDVKIDPDHERTNADSLADEIASASTYATGYGMGHHAVDGGNLPERDRRVLVLRLFELPSPTYPRGRRMVCTKTHLLLQLDSLPGGNIPLLGLGYMEDPLQPYDLSLLQDAIPVQGMVNDTFSRYLAILRQQKTHITREELDGAGADLAERVNEKQRYVEITYKPGHAPPQFAVPPLNSQQLLSGMDKLQSLMGEICGVHDVSQGAPSPDAKSGLAIRLLQDSDQQMMAPFHVRLERFLRERTRRRLDIAARYVKEPRAWGINRQLDASGQASRVLVSDIPSLRNGGSAVVDIVPGSATPRLPEAQDAEIREYHASGLLGEPGDPDAAETALRSMQSPAAARILQVKKAVRADREKQQTAQLMAEQMVPPVSASPEELAADSPTAPGAPAASAQPPQSKQTPRPGMENMNGR